MMPLCFFNVMQQIFALLIDQLRRGFTVEFKQKREKRQVASHHRTMAKYKASISIMKN